MFYKLKSNLLFFILDLSDDKFRKIIYLKLKRFSSSQKPYFPELILNFISFKVKSKAHINI